MRKVKGWEGAPNYRWTKEHKGKRYRITCAELGLPDSQWTLEKSYPSFKAWWEAKLAEATLDPIQETFDATIAKLHLSDLEKLVEQGELARRLLSTGKAPGALTPVEAATALNGLQSNIAFALAQAGDKLDVATISNFSTKHHAKEFLRVSLAKGMKPRTYEELSGNIDKITEALPGDVRKINETVVRSSYLTLADKPIASSEKKKVWGFYKRLIRYFWSERLLELPRNLDSFSFKVTAKKIKTYDLGDIKSLLAVLPERLKLYALLGLNCGMLGVDVGSMKQAELSQDCTRIIRKRTKTEDQINTPEVNYKLWPELTALLLKHRADHPTFALTSSHNTQLWDYKIVDGKTKEKDLVRQQWKTAKLPLPHKAFRSIATTMLESSKDHRWAKELFLAHSAKTIADKHYAAYDQKNFDKALDWLRKQFGLATK